MKFQALPVVFLLSFRGNLDQAGSSLGLLDCRVLSLDENVRVSHALLLMTF